MTLSLTIVLLILGQIYLALFCLSRKKKSYKAIARKTYWPSQLKFAVPLLSWLVYIQLDKESYSFLSNYSKIIFGIVITLMVVSISLNKYKEKIS